MRHTTSASSSAPTASRPVVRSTHRAIPIDRPIAGSAARAAGLPGEEAQP